MRTSFLHAADLRLGLRVPGEPQAAEVAAAQFDFVVDFAIEQRSAFVLFAGNLFDTPDLDPGTVQTVLRGLTRLRAKSIDAIAIEGQRDFRNSPNDLTWYGVLGKEGLISVLNADIRGGATALRSWDRPQATGSFLDIGRTRIFGMHYYGAMTGLLLGEVADAIGRLDNREADFRIFLVHAALETFAPGPGCRLSYSELLMLQRQVQYVALGGFERAYEAERWAFNPGASGLFQVTVDTAVMPKHQARQVDYPIAPVREHLPREQASRSVLEREVLERQAVTEEARQDGSAMPEDVLGMARQLLWQQPSADELLERALQVTAGRGLD